ncbi:MAG: hypothetical protein JW870_17430 [Candidatus Delongbacteria bacterium]|nr:hypothetical protein [Candidatus Delongbacteria bacterium]
MSKQKDFSIEIPFEIGKKIKSRIEDLNNNPQNKQNLEKYESEISDTAFFILRDFVTGKLLSEELRGDYESIFKDIKKINYIGCHYRGLTKSNVRRSKYKFLDGIFMNLGRFLKKNRSPNLEQEILKLSNVFKNPHIKPYHDDLYEIFNQFFLEVYLNIFEPLGTINQYLFQSKCPPGPYSIQFDSTKFNVNKSEVNIDSNLCHKLLPEEDRISFLLSTLCFIFEDLDDLSEEDLKDESKIKKEISKILLKNTRITENITIWNNSKQREPILKSFFKKICLLCPDRRWGTDFRLYTKEIRENLTDSDSRRKLLQISETLDIDHKDLQDIDYIKRIIQSYLLYEPFVGRYLYTFPVVSANDLPSSGWSVMSQESLVKRNFFIPITMQLISNLIYSNIIPNHIQNTIHELKLNDIKETNRDLQLLLSDEEMISVFKNILLTSPIPEKLVTKIIKLCYTISDFNFFEGKQIQFSFLLANKYFRKTILESNEILSQNNTEIVRGNKTACFYFTNDLISNKIRDIDIIYHNIRSNHGYLKPDKYILFIDYDDYEENKGWKIDLSSCIDVERLRNYLKKTHMYGQENMDFCGITKNNTTVLFFDSSTIGEINVYFRGTNPLQYRARKWKRPVSVQVLNNQLINLYLRFSDTNPKVKEEIEIRQKLISAFVHSSVKFSKTCKGSFFLFANKLHFKYNGFDSNESEEVNLGKVNSKEIRESDTRKVILKDLNRSTKAKQLKIKHDDLEKQIKTIEESTECDGALVIGLNGISGRLNTKQIRTECRQRISVELSENELKTISDKIITYPEIISFGTKHSTALDIIVKLRSKDCFAVVISEDGPITLFYWDIEKEQPVLERY